MQREIDCSDDFTALLHLNDFRNLIVQAWNPARKMLFADPDVESKTSRTICVHLPRKPARHQRIQEDITRAGEDAERWYEGKEITRGVLKRHQ